MVHCLHDRGAHWQWCTACVRARPLEQVEAMFLKSSEQAARDKARKQEQRVWW